jgi:hypothetical protein
MAATAAAVLIVTETKVCNYVRWYGFLRLPAEDLSYSPGLRLKMDFPCSLRRHFVAVRPHTNKIRVGLFGVGELERLTFGTGFGL